MRRVRRILASLVAAALVAIPLLEVEAQEPVDGSLESSPTEGRPTESTTADARAHFEAGMAAMERGQTEQAIDAFRASLDRLPYLPTAFNLAVAYEAAGRARDAVELLEQIRAGELGAVSAEQSRDAAALYESVRARVGLVELRASGAEGIWVRVDGEPRAHGVSPRPLRIALDPGHHVLQVGADGQRPRRVGMRLVAGGINRLVVRFDDRQTGTLRVVSETAERLEILGFATGPSPLEHELPAGVYEVGLAGVPASRRTVRVEASQLRMVRLTPGGEGDDVLVVSLVVAALAAVVGASIAIGVVLASDQAPLEEPVFGVIGALRF